MTSNILHNYTNCICTTKRDMICRLISSAAWWLKSETPKKNKKKKHFQRYSSWRKSWKSFWKESNSFQKLSYYHFPKRFTRWRCENRTIGCKRTAPNQSWFTQVFSLYFSFSFFFVIKKYNTSVAAALGRRHQRASKSISKKCAKNTCFLSYARRFYKRSLQ